MKRDNTKPLLIMLTVLLAVYVLNFLLGDTEAIKVNPEVSFDVGASVSFTDNERTVAISQPADRERFLLNGRPGEKCFLDPTDLLIMHNANGDCQVIDVNGNFWYINPGGGRVLSSSCPITVSQSAARYESYAEPSKPNPGIITVESWTPEHLNSARCDERLILKLKKQYQQILEGG